MSITIEVVCAVSLDGKISTPDRAPWRWSDPADREWLLARMEAADLLVVGAGTVRAENPSLALPDASSRRRREAGRSGQPARLVLSPSLRIAADARALEVRPALVASRPEVLAARGRELPEHVHRLAWPQGAGILGVLRPALEIAGGTRVVCLGGGRTNATFLEEDLVDRISLTISSFVVGAAGAPGPFEGQGFGPGSFPRFRRERIREAGRDIILEYARDRSEGS